MCIKSVMVESINSLWEAVNSELMVFIVVQNNTSTENKFDITFLRVFK